MKPFTTHSLAVVAALVLTFTSISTIVTVPAAQASPVSALVA